MQKITYFKSLIVFGFAVGLATACGGATEEKAINTDIAADAESAASAVNDSASDSVEASDAPAEAHDDNGGQAHAADTDLAEHDHDEEADSHDHDKEHHAHDDEAHDHDDDAHDAHDHDDHARNVGEGSLTAHVHGEGQLVVVKTSTGFSANFIAPLASLGLDPSLTETSKISTSITDDWISANGAAKCKRDEGQGYLVIDRMGDHGELDIDASFSCANVDKLKSVDLMLFDVSDSLEKVTGLVMHDGNQSAETLTPKNHTVILH